MQPDVYRFLEVKEVGEDGTFTGIASVYGVEDLGGDVIDKGAFRKTIAENPTVKILWQHDPSEVIGTGQVKEWQGKILLEAKLDLDDPVGQKAYRKLKNKLIEGLSIGFQTIKSSWEDVEGRMVRHISELKLWEVSVVTFPMLPAATVTRVKSTDENLEARIRELEAQVSALTAAKGTPAEPEPPQATEPPPVTTEPAAIDHSGLAASLDSMLALLQ